jgi:hypothetical protein
MNSEKSQPTKCEDYELSKRSKGQLLQLFSHKQIFFMISGTNLDQFYHFLTVFCQQMGSATAQMHHLGCIAAAFLAYMLGYDMPEQALI